MDLLINADAFLSFATTDTPTAPTPTPAPAPPVATGNDADCPLLSTPAESAQCPASALREKQRARLYAYLVPRDSDSPATAQWKRTVSAYLGDRLIDVDELCEMMTMQATCDEKKRFIFQHVQRRHLEQQRRGEEAMDTRDGLEQVMVKRETVDA
ncbi:hypothetical protein AMAG_18788 [Allomyces macrogynus ATCC 38327]|uniref:Uncharacterized protein n=1 Tax=Allomyces macrogynus (strain ATCC 38327) TaxID=578462 RepID=A0A0L0SHJ3_ALLM3|nr:hypothetical protein AMAG_18788 [Allomyces macrogynus ATCC 38327]|eukprot:KNE61958.1 hypothetical protein AMAG_18788 [Allomyces macrogynus ATCC 38327]